MKYVIVTMAVFGLSAMFFWLSGAPIERGEAVAGMFVFSLFLTAATRAFLKMYDAGNKPEEHDEN